jgi:hypothetical protein
MWATGFKHATEGQRAKRQCPGVNHVRYYNALERIREILLLVKLRIFVFVKESWYHDAEVFLSKGWVRWWYNSQTTPLTSPEIQFVVVWIPTINCASACCKPRFLCDLRLCIDLWCHPRVQQYKLMICCICELSPSRVCESWSK